MCPFHPSEDDMATVHVCPFKGGVICVLFTPIKGGVFYVKQNQPDSKQLLFRPETVDHIRIPLHCTDLRPE